MPIKYVSGNLFESGCPTLVNTVNCVGAMGKGVALEFKTRFPALYAEYREECRRGRLRPGQLFVWSNLTGDVTVVNFPTKLDWRDPSTYEYVEAGLVALRAYLAKRPGTRIAMPALGCGLGELSWPKVKSLIEKHVSNLEAKIIVYAPDQRR